MVRFSLHILLGNFKDPQQPDTSEHGDAERWHHLRLGEHHLADRPHHHEAVETIEQRHEVTLDNVEKITTKHIEMLMSTKCFLNLFIVHSHRSPYILNIKGDDFIDSFPLTCKPKLYILTNISSVKRATKNALPYS